MGQMDGEQAALQLRDDGGGELSLRMRVLILSPHRPRGWTDMPSIINLKALQGQSGTMPSSSPQYHSLSFITGNDVGNNS